MKTRIIRSGPFVLTLIGGALSMLLITGCQSLNRSKPPVCPVCSRNDTLMEKGSQWDPEYEIPTDMVAAKCPACKTTYELDAQKLGKFHECNNCGTRVKECSKCRASLR